MSEASGAARRGPSHRRVELAVAIVIAIFGAVVMYGSLQVGINWGVEGPRAGFFPFYVGLVIVLCSAINLLKVLRELTDDELFADWGQLRSVLSVVVPTTVYVALLPYIGIYLASLLMIAFFMKWLGRYPWPLTLALSIGVPLVTYMMFEKWFLVPLPKGPIEDWLGL